VSERRSKRFSLGKRLGFPGSYIGLGRGVTFSRLPAAFVLEVSFEYGVGSRPPSAFSSLCPNGVVISRGFPFVVRDLLRLSGRITWAVVYLYNFPWSASRTPPCVRTQGFATTC
jgi:hypothetical protein